MAGASPLKHVDTNVDYYAMLDLPHSADLAAIKKRYYKLSLQLHPDKHTQTQVDDPTDRYHHVKLAYELLSDPSTKSAYDAIWRVKHERQERLATQSNEKRRFKEDLQAREAIVLKEANETKRNKTNHALQSAHIEQLRYDANRMLRQQQNRLLLRHQLLAKYVEKDKMDGTNSINNVDHTTTTTATPHTPLTDNISSTRQRIDKMTTPLTQPTSGFKSFSFTPSNQGSSISTQEYEDRTLAMMRARASQPQSNTAMDMLRHNAERKKVIEQLEQETTESNEP